MRRIVVAFVTAVVLASGLAAATAGLAAADPAPAPAAAAPAGGGSVDPSLLTEPKMKTPEILSARPSGFWTSNRPAIGGAYRYRLMLLGLAIASAMAVTTVVVIRRSARRA